MSDSDIEFSSGHSTDEENPSSYYEDDFHQYMCNKQHLKELYENYYEMIKNHNSILQEGRLFDPNFESPDTESDLKILLDEIKKLNNHVREYDQRF